MLFINRIYLNWVKYANFFQTNAKFPIASILFAKDPIAIIDQL